MPLPQVVSVEPHLREQSLFTSFFYMFSENSEEKKKQSHCSFQHQILIGEMRQTRATAF